MKKKKRKRKKHTKATRFCIPPLISQCDNLYKQHNEIQVADLHHVTPGSTERETRFCHSTGDLCIYTQLNVQEHVLSVHVKGCRPVPSRVISMSHTTQQEINTWHFCDPVFHIWHTPGPLQVPSHRLLLESPGLQLLIFFFFLNDTLTKLLRFPQDSTATAVRDCIWTQFWFFFLGTFCAWTKQNKKEAIVK